MIAAVAVLSIFAALWACAGIVLAHAAQLMMAIPIAVSLALGAMALQRVNRLPARSAGDGRRIGRLVGLWSAIEVAAMIVAVNVLQYAGRNDLAMAAVCGIVGLHFLPLAREIPATIYWFTGAAMIAVALAGLAVPTIVTPILVSFGAAFILWATVGAIAAGWRLTPAPAASRHSPH